MATDAATKFIFESLMLSPRTDRVSVSAAADDGKLREFDLDAKSSQNS
tara:strand:+ start:39155 stop:39298 length:144 start_codon:yes stop_codon:yes gene_type:complete